MSKRPVRRPNQSKTLLRLHDQVLVAELRAAGIRHVVQIGHEHEMSGAFGLALARSFGVEGLVAP